MSTRSAIGILRDNGEIHSIYCHSDGYTSYNGYILNRYYDTQQKINALIDLGNLSSLGADIGEKHNWSERGQYFTVEYDGETRNISSFCTFYGRDRGDDDEHHSVSHSEKQFKNQYSDAEYFYLWKKGEWYVSDVKNQFAKLINLL